MATEAREKIVKTDEEWKAQLSPLAFKVARRKGTERAFTHDDFPKGPGLFRCLCCDQPLFEASTKFDSGTGWPSFTAPVDADAVDEKDDRSWFMRRTEVLCSRCDAHLGHVFPDGPAPTGLRYCMNGSVMRFDPAED
ncbi:peptide-methionine (R)-S-oxide reductase MsrB [Oceanomicrobium pacificus]|uniref:peptide-methionine (R)-S-oxide reductase n=1 Tax=Oceanomicrobium pacificus TaxID=2692916 RepID=A0A6B0TWG8_9RHOB|nr:peptide-methionine (R)-S-oxide reductase MsrB [Oceanomicrobium pacificus]MXU65504.1 peptide-methionine (R)-S-oxide reductase MsrB [Oceanomicrobium pacificus]